MVLTRLNLQNLADRRIADAKVLIDGGRYDAGYYMAGYSVECGLKACIANLWKTEVFPEKSFVSVVYIHDLEKLIGLASLKAVFDADTAANAILFGYWATVRDWTEHSRYDNKDETAARELYEAITSNPDGVLPWIKRYW
jgi:HEPN domain-containing protein